MLTTLLLIQILATGFMTGLIWFVQVVHYPLFSRVGTREFVAYEDAHVRRTTLIVAPAMLVEAAVALALLVFAPDRAMQLLAWIGFALLVLIWISTIALQVPRHRELATGFVPASANRLSNSNWIRTAAWSIRLLVATAMLAAALPPIA